VQAQDAVKDVAPPPARVVAVLGRNGEHCLGCHARLLVLRKRHLKGTFAITQGTFAII
jgi:hypothetical protein